MSKNNANKFSPEVRERAVRLVQESRGEYPSLWVAVESIAPKIGCSAQTLLTWVKRHEVDSGQREGVTTSERERIKEFWLGLGEEERRALVKVEKEAVLKKMKEQQKHSCSCAVCGRKRYVFLSSHLGKFS